MISDLLLGAATYCALITLLLGFLAGAKRATQSTDASACAKTHSGETQSRRPN